MTRPHHSPGLSRFGFPFRTKSSVSELHGHSDPENPSIHIGAIIGNVLVSHVLHIQGQREVFVQAETGITLCNLSLINTGIPTLQVAVSDTDVVLLPTPELPTDVDASGIKLLIEEG
jgi:hypothetical protein